MPKFKVGDRVVLNQEYNGGVVPYGLPNEDHNSVFVVHRVEPAAISPVHVVKEGTTEPVYGGYFHERFKEAPVADENMNRNVIFGITSARAARQQLIDAEVGATNVRIRSRSWDNEGRYFAIEVKTHNGVRKLYKPADVTAYLAEINPIDLEPYLESRRLGTIPVYQFQVGGRYIPAPDGSYWWTVTDMKQTKGLADFAGKRYRLGRKVFTPFVA